MRRLLLLGLGVALVAAGAGPSAASAAGSVGYQYLTTYKGTYDFTDSFRDEPGLPDGLETQQHYEWLTYDYETIVVRPDRTYTQTLTSYIIARGDSRQVQVQGSGFPGGPFTTTRSCQIYSDSTPVVISGGGGYIQPVLAKKNPLLEVGWMLPDHGATPSRYVPPFHLSGSRDCAGGSTWLEWSPGHSGTVYAGPATTREMDRAFGGSATIRYGTISRKPWMRDFNVTIQNRVTTPGFRGPAVDASKVAVRSQVQFERTYGDTLPNTPLRTRNKLVDLLIDQGFLGLQAQGPQGGPPVGASGDPDTVVIPGFGPGEVSLDVSGTVVGGRAHDAAVGGTRLASARTDVRRGSAPVRLTIVPTAAGARLKAPHAAFNARYVLSYRPAGSRTTYSGVRTWAVPARP